MWLIDVMFCFRFGERLWFCSRCDGGMQLDAVGESLEEMAQRHLHGGPWGRSTNSRDIIRLVIDKTIIFNIPLHYSGLILFTLFVLGILMLIVVLISFFRFLRAYSWKNAVALSPFSPSCFDNGHQERNSPPGGSGC